MMYSNPESRLSRRTASGREQSLLLTLATSQGVPRLPSVPPRQGTVPDAARRILLRPRLGHRDDARARRVPEHAAQLCRNLGQADAPDVDEQMSELLVAVDEAVVRNPRREVMDVVIADVRREPVQPARQRQKAGALEHCAVVV